MSLSGNTEKINELLSKINALPEAGSGGTTLETSEVEVKGCMHVFYTGLDDNGLVCAMESTGANVNSSHAITVVRNTPILIGRTLNGADYATGTGGTMTGYYSRYYAVWVATEANSSVSFWSSGSGGGN